jgi:hypothetical protein
MAAALFTAQRSGQRAGTAGGSPHVTPALGIIADTMTANALRIAPWAQRVLGTNWSSSVGFKERHELIEGGPYRLAPIERESGSGSHSWGS